MQTNERNITTTADSATQLQQLRHLAKQHPDEFVAEADGCIALARAEDNKLLLAELLLEKCSYLNHSSQYLLSNECAFECAELAGMVGEDSLQANALKMAGVNYSFTGELFKAREAYNQGIRILEGKGQLSSSDKNVLASLYYNLFTLYREFEIDNTRLQYIETSLRLFTETENKQGIARCHIAYANHYPGIKDTDEAIEYNKKAKELFKEIGDKRGEGNCEINIGYRKCLSGAYTEGMESLNRGAELLKQSGSLFYVFNAYLNIAEAYKLQKNYNKALEYFGLAEGLSKNSALKLNFAGMYESWAITLEEQGNYKEALEKHKRCLTEKEKAYHFDKSSAVSDTQMLFELEERKRESDFLKKKNAEIEYYSRKLEVSNYELAQFAHVASHDLREPLRMVSMYMQLLERRAKDKLNADERQYLYFAKEGANRMFDLTRGLLELSKIKTIRKIERVNLNEVLAEVTHFLKPETDRRMMSISSTDLPEITASKVLMLQLFENLVSNAVKFNLSKQPVLAISWSREGGYDCISFCDNGIGIQEKYRDKVFGIFQRLHFRNEYTGTGIGLTMCKKIVEQLNGRIWIEDGKDGGCNFRISIPVKD